MLEQENHNNINNNFNPSTSVFVTKDEFYTTCAKIRLGKLEFARLVLAYNKSDKKIPSFEDMKEKICFDDYPIKNLDSYLKDIENNFKEVFG